jgi:hypothetical protein
MQRGEQAKEEGFMGRRGRKHPRDGRMTRDMTRIKFREDFETDANRRSRSTFERVFFLWLV